MERDGLRYPRDSIIKNYEENDFIYQYKDLTLFFEEYVVEELLNPLLSYLDMKTKNSIDIKYLRNHADLITPRKTQPPREYGADRANA